MTEVVELPEMLHRSAERPRRPAPAPPRPAEANLTEAICRVLDASSQPLTPAKIRVQLPAALRRLSPESLVGALTRQVEAGVLYLYCPYRSQQPRYWSRPMTDHIAEVIRTALVEGPLTWSQLVRKLPEYATARAEEVLQTQLTARLVHRHPGSGPRGGERYGLQPPDAREPLRQELVRLFARMQERLGFTEDQLRSAALEVLREEEWGQPEEQPSDPRYQE